MCMCVYFKSPCLLEIHTEIKWWLDLLQNNMGKQVGMSGPIDETRLAMNWSLSNDDEYTKVH